MNGRAGLLALLASLLVLALVQGAGTATAKPLDSCRGIHAQGQPYGLGKKKVGCRFVRKWARRYLREGARPPGWSCSGRSFEVGNCHEQGGVALFQFFVED